MGRKKGGGLVCWGVQTEISLFFASIRCAGIGQKINLFLFELRGFGEFGNYFGDWWIFGNKSGWALLFAFIFQSLGEIMIFKTV